MVLLGSGGRILMSRSMKPPWGERMVWWVGQIQIWRESLVSRIQKTNICLWKGFTFSDSDS